VITHRETYESNFFHHDFENLEKSVRDIRPFWRPLFCHSSVVKYWLFHLFYSSEPVMRLDCQISLKSPPLNLLAGSAPACTQPFRTTRKLFVGFKRFRCFFSKSSREKYVHVAKICCCKEHCNKQGFCKLLSFW